MTVNDWYEFIEKYKKKLLKVNTNFTESFICTLFDIENNEEEEPLDLICFKDENGKDIEIDIKDIISIEIIE